MRNSVIFLVLLTACLAYGARLNYRQPGDYMIGAILPMTSGVNCSNVNPKGVTLAEAIVHGVEMVNNKDRSLFKDLNTKFGYDIRDNCGKSAETEYIILDLVQEKTDKKRKKSKKEPVQVVISEFPVGSAKDLPVLTSQGISQISFSRNNARLKKDASVAAFNIKNLISMYPASNKKILAAAEFIKDYQFGYVHVVASDNAAGKKAASTLSANLKTKSICSDVSFAKSKADVGAVLKKVAANPRIRVLVVHATKDIELALYKEANKQNMTNLIIMSTQDWMTTQGGQLGMSPSVKQYARVIDGMIFFFAERKDDYLQKQHLPSWRSPYPDRPWLQKLFESLGGDKSCIKTRGLGQKCAAVDAKVTQALTQSYADAVYAFEAVYAIAYALKGAQKAKISLSEAIKGLKVTIPSMAQNRIVFDDDLSVATSLFQVYNVQGNKQDTVGGKLVAIWDDTMPKKLHKLNEQVMWKEGSLETPVSLCSASCVPGFKRSFKDQSRKCCWTCAKCPNATASNVTNSDQCLSCPAGEVVTPKQNGCIKYKLLNFNWLGPAGIVIIILMILSVVLIIFALCVFSHHNLHEIVLHSGYNSLCFFLLACLLLILTPIPLLIKPTVSSCFAYIIVANVAISMVLGVLMSRSAYINGFFDENGELVKGSLGRFPRGVVVVLIIILSIIVHIVAYNMESLQVMHNKTDRWDQRYHECSSWDSLTFWAGFIFNVVISVIANSMSCSSSLMADHSFELKYVLQCHLVFYLVALIELCVFFRSNDEHLAGGQGVCCILYALGFYAFYAAPKIWIILFRSKGNKAIEEAEDDDEEGPMMTTAVHASAGFKHHGIVQMKIRDED